VDHNSFGTVSLTLKKVVEQAAHNIIDRYIARRLARNAFIMYISGVWEA